MTPLLEIFTSLLATSHHFATVKEVLYYRNAIIYNASIHNDDIHKHCKTFVQGLLQWFCNCTLYASSFTEAYAQ